MRNACLYKALKEYCKAALTLLNAKFKEPRDLPMKEKFEVSESGAWSQSSVGEVDWLVLILINEESLGQMNVYEAAIQAMEEDERVAMHLNTLVGTSTSRGLVTGDMCLRSLLAELLHEQQDLDFREAIFNRIYKGIEDYFYRDVLEYRCFSPLGKFQMETERIELGPKFSIIKIPKEEIEEMLSESRLLSPLVGLPLPRSEYAFELYIEMPKVIGDAHVFPQADFPREDSLSQVAQRKFDEACSALRLFKNGTVSYYNHIRMKTTSWDPHGGQLTWGKTAPGLLRGTRYVLSNNEIPDFLEFWQFYQKARQMKRNQIKIALRRFNFGYERTRPEDKLIDYMIGFEALLLGNEQELRYKLALRGSALLGKNSGERKRTFDELQEAYKQRNKIVHGSTPKEAISIGSETVQFKDLVSKVEEHLRSAIKEFLVRCEKQSASQVIKALDEKIVRGSQSQEVHA